jgi:hypothetical protein
MFSGMFKKKKKMSRCFPPHFFWFFPASWNNYPVKQNILLYQYLISLLRRPVSLRPVRHHDDEQKAISL